jgi:hypothetical protein
MFPRSSPGPASAAAKEAARKADANIRLDWDLMLFPHTHKQTSYIGLPPLYRPAAPGYSTFAIPNYAPVQEIAAGKVNFWVEASLEQ